ncbi:hypothetical protein BTUL_0448g00020 [Botrytis tulipae]|uniref:MalT-like TPR region domain-containing protein n=1 Tax=Botrytis tulipae TaxID=87230 RepID=A0A4Z1EBZ0_9HELO|nr:hypothetical protein BTUL_0448g00020 [Botrytis tulipae]
MITDGGGIRGLSELIILDEIMNRLKYALKSPVDLLPADYEITKYLPQSDFGLIIVTGRHPVANDLGCSITIGDLLEEEAMNLLFHRTKKERTHANVEDARKICCHLSCLALAVDQAGAYIKSTGIGLSLFIEHFDKQQENIMAWSLPLKNYKRLDPAAPDQEITLTVSTTWELSYNRISGSKEIVEAKRHFLLISAYFGDNCVDEYVFRQFFETNSERLSWINMFQDQETHKWDSSAFLAVVTELRDLSLFRSNSVLSQGAVYSFHPMTRKWALYRQSQTERQDLALEAMDILINSNFDMPADENLVYPLTDTKQHSLPHIESCFLSCEEFVSESQAIGTSRTRKIGYTLAAFFLRHGHLGRSELIFKRIILCPMKDAPTIWIYSLCGLSVVLKESLRFQEAIELLTEALDSLPGPPMVMWCECRFLPYLALVYYKMARSDLGEQRKLYEACTILKKALAIIKRESGKKRPIVRNESPSVYSDIPGSMDLAQNLLDEALDLSNKWEMIRRTSHRNTKLGRFCQEKRP